MSMTPLLYFWQKSAEIITAGRPEKKGRIMDINLLIFSIAAVIAVFFSYRQGVKDGTSLVKNGAVEQARGPVLFKKSALKETDEERRNRIALENIENYATGAAQKEVK